MDNSNIERIDAARETAQKIITICDSYQRAPCQATLNHFLASVERLADLAEDMDVQETLKMLDA